MNHCQVEEINQLFSDAFGHMKQDRPIFNLVMNETGWHFMYSHEISQNSLGDTTWLLHDDYRKQFKGNAERYAVYKEADIVRKRESRKKALSPRTATNSRDGNSEKKVNWVTLHVKAMKYHKTVWGTQHAFYAGHFKFQSSQLWKNSLK